MLDKDARLVSTEDYYAIDELLARYCWAFDDGDIDAYVKVWTGNGRLSGFGDPIEGMDNIKAVAAGNFGQTAGKQRHLLSNLTVSYDGDGTDAATAIGYNKVANFGPDAKLFANVLETFRCRRTADGWRVAEVDLKFT